MTELAQMIVDQLENDPPDHYDPHPKLFSDLEDKSLHDSLFKLWRKGILDAEWDPEEEGTDWWMTEFGVELHDAGLTRAYVTALEKEIQLDVGPDARVDPEQFV